MKYIISTLLAVIPNLLLLGNAHADTGVVRLYNETRGYGFINPDDGTNPIFFLGERVLYPKDALGLTNGMCVAYTPYLAEADQYASKDHTRAKDISIFDCN